MIRKAWIALAAAVVVAAGIVAFVSYGHSVSGTPPQLLASWAKSTSLGQDIGTLEGDGANVRRAVASRTGASAVRTVCAAMANDAQTFGDQLPSPNSTVTQLLASAYGLEYDAAQICYRAGSTNRPLLARSARDRAPRDLAVRPGALPRATGYRDVCAHHHHDGSRSHRDIDLLTGEPDAEMDDRLRRRVLWAMPSGLYVVGSRAEDGDVCNLMTANLAMQVAIEPKLVAVAIDADATTDRLVRDAGCFALSVLSREDRDVVRRFVKPVRRDQVEVETGAVVSMAGEPVTFAATGAPILARAVAWIDCEVRHMLELGSHDLFVGEVVAVGGPDPGTTLAVLRMEDTRMNYGG